MCLYPRTIRNPKYRANKKNQGNIPKCKDDRLTWINIPCGKCMECHKSRGRQWQTRLMHEIKDDPRAHMVTLTLNTEHLRALTTIAQAKGYGWGYSLDNAVAKLSVRRFYDRWRKATGEKNLKHWIITELGKGPTEHMHLHGILWTDHPDKIQEVWKYGFIHRGKYCNHKSVSYMMKYFLKQDDAHPNYKPRVLASQGLGKGYIKSHLASFNRYQGKDTKEFYVAPNGKRIAIPKYWRDRLYTEDQREDLRLHKLDTNVRYVAGQKATTTRDDVTEYTWLLNSARNKNSRLQYGPYPNQWYDKQQEEIRREAMQKKRLEIIPQQSLPSEDPNEIHRPKTKHGRRGLGRKPTDNRSRKTLEDNGTVRRH